MKKFESDQVLQYLSVPDIVISFMQIAIGGLGISGRVSAEWAIGSWIFGTFVLIRFLNYKKKYEDLYKLLCVLAENNKLHPLREAVMIFKRNMDAIDKQYLFNIAEATFQYRVKAPESQDKGYDVDYVLALQSVDKRSYSQIKAYIR